MTATEAAKSLFQTYSKYGASFSTLQHLVQTGTKNYRMTIEAAYHSLRFTLGHLYGEPERFNLCEISEMMGEDEQITMQRISGLLEQGESVSVYFPCGL